MPGIAGVIGRGVSAKAEAVVSRMIACMRHEPGYAGGLRYVAECGACVGWLAHPDSFASHTSGTSDEGFELAFAGECFNTTGLINAPNDKGALSKAFQREGPRIVRELNGLFSGALLDRSSGRSYLFLDRYSSERLYYYQGNDTLYFASEAKALLAVLPELRHFDLDGVADYLAFGSCRADRTLFRGVARIPAASLWEFESGEIVSQRTYFDCSEWENLGQLTDLQFESAFVDTARSVMPHYAQAESGIGFSITGGLDTRMIMASLADKVSNLGCYTYGAEAGDTLDVSVGRTIANSLGYSHQTLRIDLQFLAGFKELLDESVYLSDGCANALNTHELFFSRMARDIAPVRLTGNFGSEVLRSMSTLKPLSVNDGLIDGEFQARIDDAIETRRYSNPLSGTVFDEIPSHLFGSLAIARTQLTFRTPYLDNALVELAYRAPESSRRSPSAALRLIASGHEKLREHPTDLGYACGKPSPLDTARRFLRKISFKLDYWDKEGLPPELAFLDRVQPLLSRTGILGQHKFLPYRHWFKDELLELVSQAAGRAATGGRPWWRPGVVKGIAAEHASGRKNLLREINAVLTLDAIERVLLSSATAPHERGNNPEIAGGSN